MRLVWFEFIFILNSISWWLWCFFWVKIVYFRNFSKILKLLHSFEVKLKKPMSSFWLTSLSKKPKTDGLIHFYQITVLRIPLVEVSVSKHSNWLFSSVLKCWKIVRLSPINLIYLSTSFRSIMIMNVTRFIKIFYFI